MQRPNRWVFLLLFLLCLFLYFYRYPKMLAFDADGEFYASQYLHIVREHKFTLLGIETSIGGMFVGPLYTYLSVFIYWLFHGDPMGIFLFTLFFSSFQASLTYYLFTKLKNQKVGLLAGFLVLISSSLWNKAFAPSAINFIYPMGLFFFYILVKLKDKRQYFLWLGVILALTLQIHFSLFFFFPISIIFLLWQRLLRRKYLRFHLEMLSPVFISFLPLLIFDLRHQFFITNNLWKFINQNNTLQVGGAGFFWGLVELFSHVLSAKPDVSIYVFLACVLAFFLTKVTKEFAYKVIGLIYIVSIVLFLLYSGSKPDYFFYFLLAPFFFVTSDFLASLSKIRFLNYLVFVFLAIIAWQNLWFINATLNHYNYYLKRQVAKYIKDESGGKPVKITYDTELGLGFGFDYLLKYEGVNVNNNNYDEIFHIVMRSYKDYQGKEFKEDGSPVSIKVVKLSTSKNAERNSQEKVLD